LALRADVGVEKEVFEAFQQIAANFDQINILINNAGVELYKDFLKFQTTEWHRLLDVNLNSVCNFALQPSKFMNNSVAV
jgi:NADP-dependent 3-hydroxy acid dehydrogenase YdfG